MNYTSCATESKAWLRVIATLGRKVGAEMNISTYCSNQWSIGIALRRCTLQTNDRWMISVNYGFKYKSISWERNPRLPRSGRYL